MNISQRVIKMKLEEWGYQVSGRQPGKGMYLARPAFYVDADQVPESYVYLLPDQESLPRRTGTPKMLFVTGMDQEIPEEAAYGVIQIEETMTVYERMNLIQKVFDFYNHWEETLRMALEEEISLQALLDESTEIFGNPLTISSADFFLLAYSSIMEEKEELRELLEPNNLFEYCTAFKQDEEYNRARNYHHAFYYPEYITGYRNLCVNIFDHGIYTYRIAIPEACDCFRPGMQELLEYMAGFVEKILRHSSRTDTDQVNTLPHILESALSGSGLPAEQITQKLMGFGWNPEHSYVCLDFQTAMLDQQNMTVNFICRHIESLISHACAFQHQEDIVVFVNLTRFGGTTEDVYRKIILFLRDSFLKMGISRSFSGFQELPYYYRQAQTALETGNRCHPYQWAHSFEDTAVFYMLHNAPGDFPAKICCSEKLLKLYEYDKEHQTELFRTLKVYLENNENAVQSARELFIHRSTFLYRLDRIREMTGMDLSNKDQRLYYLMSYRILELLNAAQV
ncbi:MAG: helix-turn-helix domain-containing protein [Candidatus Limivivens sp.]|nr:helix-turn-helix domain-containing protein [Candidatus Limivivens sp.]